MAALVEVIHGEHFAEVRMSSPPVNAFSLAFFDELSCALREAMPGMGALVLTSAVDGIFAAGGDLPYMAQADEAESKRYVELCQEIYCLLESPDYVSIVAIDGACLGGGMEMSLAADVRIASPRSRLGLPEVSLGVLAGGGAIHRMVRAVGQSVARDLLLTGEAVSGATAMSWGLVTRLDEEPRTAALNLARRVGQFSPEAIAATKELALSASTDEMDHGLAAELNRWSEVRRGSNAQEGLDSFVEKRRPSFVARHA